VPYLLTCDSPLNEQLLFVIGLKQDILPQALAEGREERTTIVRKRSAGFSMKLTATEQRTNVFPMVRSVSRRVGLELCDVKYSTAVSL
jgi:hypothetical protein